MDGNVCGSLTVANDPEADGCWIPFGLNKCVIYDLNLPYKFKS